MLLCGEVVLCGWVEEDGVEIEGEGDVGVVVVGVTGDLCSATITVYIVNQRELTINQYRPMYSMCQ